jgi:C-terminal processing protease CtpA/Prc
VLTDADANRVRRVVIDLRWNGGGNSRVIGPLISGLEARRKSVGPVYLLIGPTTFSSAVDNAVEMRAKLSARLVGSPSGGMPGGYGEVARLTLPNSRLVIRYTTKNFGVVAKGGTMGGGKALEPDIAAPLKIGDFLAGRDPGLEGAIHAQ